MDMKTIILSEVAQTQKDRFCIFFSLVDGRFESSDICVLSGIPWKSGRLVKGHGEEGFQERTDRT